MAFKQSNINKIPRRNKDLSFGYFREAEKENGLSAIPAMLKYLSLIYLNLNQDKFDRSNTWKTIKINQNAVENDGTEINISNAFCENLMQKGINIWKFKCNDTNHDMLGIRKTEMEYETFTASAIKKWKYPVGIGPFDEGDSRYEDFAPSVGYGIVTSSGYLTNPNNAKEAGKKLFQRGIIHNDILEMKLDCKHWTLSFRLNNGDFKHAFYIEPQFKYRAAISMDGGYSKSNYELLSFQQIY